MKVLQWFLNNICFEVEFKTLNDSEISFYLQFLNSSAKIMILNRAGNRSGGFFFKYHDVFDLIKNQLVVQLFFDFEIVINFNIQRIYIA